MALTYVLKKAGINFEEVGQNTVSFYLRTLRTLYHKAVEAGQAPPNDIFAHVQTGSVRTAKLEFPKLKFLVGILVLLAYLLIKPAISTRRFE